MITQNQTFATARLVGTIHQEGTNQLLIEAFIDTIGGIISTKVAPGNYNLISPTLKFKEDRTRINGKIAGFDPQLLSIATLNDYYIQYLVASPGLIIIYVKNAAGTLVELSSLGGIYVPINIEVYNITQTP